MALTTSSYETIQFLSRMGIINYVNLDKRDDVFTVQMSEIKRLWEDGPKIEYCSEKDFESIIIGLLLGDASIYKKANNESFIKFDQSIKNKKYFDQVFNLISLFIECKVYSRIYKDKRYPDNTYLSFSLITGSNYKLTLVRDLFYNNEKSERKSIPSNIVDYLTPIGLSH